MARYKLTTGGVIDQETKMFIPNDPRNRHWQEYQQWLKEGNEPDPEYTLEEKKTILKTQVTAKRRHLENQGITINGSSGTYELDTSLAGRANLGHTMQVFDLGILDKTNDTVNWKFNDGTYKALSYDQLVELAKFATQYIEELFNAEKVHRENIDGLTDLELANSYDIEEGWPSNVFSSTIL